MNFSNTTTTIAIIIPREGRLNNGNILMRIFLIAILLLLHSVTANALISITAINPQQGPVSGSNTVVITGTDLHNVTEVSFTGTPAVIQSQAPGEMTVVVPASAQLGTVDILLSNIDGSETDQLLAAYTYMPPTVNSIQPNLGTMAGDEIIVISGSFLTGTQAVLINGAASSFTQIDDNSISVVTPDSDGARGYVPVTLTVSSGSYTFENLFRYQAEFMAGDLAPQGAPDGVLDVGDVLLLHRYILGEEIPSAHEEIVGDIAPLGNPDSMLNVADVLILQRAIIGDISLPNVVDDRGPTVALSSPAHNTLTSGDSITFMGLLGETGSLQINGVDVTVDSFLSFSQTVQLEEGTNVFVLATVDAYGNRSSQTVTIIKDTLPPPAINIGRVTITEASGQVNINGSSGAVDPNSTVQFTVNGTTFSVLADEYGAFTTTFAANPGDTVQIQIIDRMGYLSPVSEVTPGTELQFIMPITSQTINTQKTNIIGTFPAINREATGVGVNGLTTCTWDNYFYISNYELAIGIQTLTAAVTNRDGSSQNASIDISRTGEDGYYFSASEYCVTTGMQLDFEVGGPGSISDIYIDFDNDGILDYRQSSPDSVLNFSYENDGVYAATAWIILDDGSQKQLTINIVVHSEPQQNALFNAIWNNMKSALLSGDQIAALQYITEDSRFVYGPVFTALSAEMSAIYDELSTIQKVDVGARIADYALIRVEDNTIQTYIINFQKNSDGLWRIDSM